LIKETTEADSTKIASKSKQVSLSESLILKVPLRLIIKTHGRVYFYLKSVKKNDDLTVFFALLGSGHVKAVHKMMVKSSPDVGCGNMLLQS